MTSAAPRPRRTTARSAVVDLAQARDARRLRDLADRCRAIDEGARRSLSRLFQCGAIFSRHGARLGRELLLSHQHLLRAAVLVGQASECDETDPQASDALFREATALVERSTQIIARCDAACARSH
ncbi:MAG TPA: hypothetical protein VIW03_06055 [Anaeromyxobacter sp.]